MRIKNIAILIFFTAILLVGCSDEINDNNIEYNSKQTIYKEYYDDITEMVGLEKIADDVIFFKAAIEYRVSFNRSVFKNDYYTFRVFKDGTGEFYYSLRTSEGFDSAPNLTDGNRQLSKNEAKALLKSIQDNNFWTTYMPDSDIGLTMIDTIIFVEGYKNGKEHFTFVCDPDDNSSIAKLHNTFADFADIIIKTPESSSE